MPKLTWPDAKKLCTEGDIDRLACLALAVLFSSCNSIEATVYNEAASAYSTTCKPESYSRQLRGIVKKIKEARGEREEGKATSGGEGEGEGKGEETIVVKPLGVGRSEGRKKRKAAAAVASDDGDGEVTLQGEKKAKRGQGKGKKAKANVVVREGEERKEDGKE